MGKHSFFDATQLNSKTRLEPALECLNVLRCWKAQQGSYWQK
jgi:hypothetical protein